MSVSMNKDLIRIILLLYMARECNQNSNKPTLFPELLSSPLVLIRVRVTQSLDLCVCVVYRYLSICPFSFGHGLFLFDIQILMAHLVFSNSSSDNPDFSCRYLVFRTKLIFPIAKANLGLSSQIIRRFL